MTLSGDVLLAACLLYVAALFGIAFFVDRATQRGRLGWLGSPVVYTLSISVYCTSWTFYGAVGSAARNGLEFITIYLGPTLVFIGWWWLLRKLVRIGREQRITSIADLISSRYGKSPTLAVFVTVLALTATTPYIALQLQSVTRSYQAVAGEADGTGTALWIAAGMAVFTILFGTRNVDANERHHGVVAAIAVEAIVKLIALLAIGIFVLLSFGGVSGLFGDVPSEVIYGGEEIFGPRWIALTFLSATAIICLPRQFQVTVVENVDERHLATASWLFPLYLFLMCLFIIPIALAGIKNLPEGSNPDLYVLTLPLAAGRDELALLAFLGGFSSATSMVIVAAIAVSTMVSNHIVMPMALRFLAGGPEISGDVRNLLLTARRVSIGVVLGLGFLYFHLSGGSDALAAIGLIAFVGVAQFLPSIVGGLFWKDANRAGAIAGLSIGAVLWAYTLFLPSFDGAVLMSRDVIDDGPWGLVALKPQSLLGFVGVDPLVHALVWSLGANALAFLVVSVLTRPIPLERLQAVQFVDVFRLSGSAPSPFQAGAGHVEALFVLAQRIMGTDTARMLFERIAQTQGMSSGMPKPTDEMLRRLERELAGSVGAASAHAMVSQIVGQAPIGMTQLFNIADETQQLMETSRKLQQKTHEVEDALEHLRDANDLLRDMDRRKDGFLSQVSHELRTPMTSIRSFSEILMTHEDIGEDERRRFVRIINDESSRLTRLLDEILDLSHLESGNLEIPREPLLVSEISTSAIDTVSPLARERRVRILRDEPIDPIAVTANSDRLRQVLINLLGNAIKYNRNEAPEILVRVRSRDDLVRIDVVDNGGGVSRKEARTIFEKFERGDRAAMGQGAGLGLPISRALMQAMGGSLTVQFEPTGSSYFQVTLPRSTEHDRIGTAAE